MLGFYCWATSAVMLLLDIHTNQQACRASNLPHLMWGGGIKKDSRVVLQKKCPRDSYTQRNKVTSLPVKPLIKKIPIYSKHTGEKKTYPV